MENILGKELYEQVMEKLGDKKIAIVSDGSYIPRQRFNELNETNKSLTAKIESFESQLSSAKKLVSSNDELKAQFAELQNKHAQELKDIQTNLINSQKTSYLREGLIKAGIKDNYLNMHLRDIKLDSINISDDGVSGITSLVDQIKTDFPDSFQNQTIKTNTNTNQSLNAGDNLFMQFK